MASIKTYTKNRPVPLKVKKPVQENIPLGPNFTQSVSVNGHVAKGKSMGKMTTISKPSAQAGNVKNSRRLSRGESKNNPTVKASGTGSSKPVAALKGHAIRGTTRLMNGSMSVGKASKSDKGGSNRGGAKLSSPLHPGIRNNRLGKKTAVSGTGVKSGLGSGGRRGRYQVTNRPTDRTV